MKKMLANKKVRYLVVAILVALLLTAIGFLAANYFSSRDIKTYEFNTYSNYYESDIAFKFDYDQSVWNVMSPDESNKPYLTTVLESKKDQALLSIRVVDLEKINTHCGEACILTCDKYADATVVGRGEIDLIRFKAGDEWFYALGPLDSEQTGNICGEMTTYKTLVARANGKAMIGITIKVKNSTEASLIAADEIAKQLFIQLDKSVEPQAEDYILTINKSPKLSVEEQRNTFSKLYHGVPYTYTRACDQSSNSPAVRTFKDINFMVEFIPNESLANFEPANPNSFTDPKTGRERPYFYGFAASIYKGDDDAYKKTTLAGLEFMTYTLGSHGCDTLYYFYKVDNHGVLVIEQDLIEELDGHRGLTTEAEAKLLKEFSKLNGVIADKGERDKIFLDAIKSIVVKQNNKAIFDLRGDSFETYKYEAFSTYYNLPYAFKFEYDKSVWSTELLAGDPAEAEWQKLVLKSDKLGTQLTIKIIDQGYINTHTSGDALALVCEDYLDSEVISVEPVRLSRLRNKEGWIYAFGEYALEKNKRVCKDKLHSHKVFATRIIDGLPDVRMQISLKIEVSKFTDQGLEAADAIARQLFSPIDSLASSRSPQPAGGKYGVQLGFPLSAAKPDSEWI
jgi:hypothetical protein